MYDTNIHTSSRFNKVWSSLVSCFSQWPPWLFQNLCIPPSFSSFPSDNLLQWENTGHQRCWFFQLSTITSINICACESPSFSFPPFTMELGDPSIYCAGFLSSLLFKNLCYESSPRLTYRQPHTDFFISDIKQAQVSTKHF